MATVTTKTDKSFPYSQSWLDELLYGREEEVNVIDPELKRRLVNEGLIGAGTSDDQALQWWTQNKGAMSGKGGSLSHKGNTYSGDSAHDNFEDVFEDYWSGSKADGQMQKRAGQGGMIGKDYNALRDMMDAWNGNPEALGRNSVIANARQANDKLAEMLTSMRESGGLPGEADIKAGTDIAGKLFQGQRTALSQRFEDMNTEYARKAASMGRDVMDPILQAKMGQEKTRQSAQLSADEGASAQMHAMNLPGQRLSYQQMMVDLQGGLAQRAWDNRSAIMAAGMQIGQSERNWRLNTSGQVSSTEQKWDFGDYLNAGLGIVGTGVGMASKLGAFGGAGAATPSPSGFGPTAPGSETGLGSMGPSSLSAGAGGLSRPVTSGGRTIASSSAYPAPVGGGNWAGPGHQYGPWSNGPGWR